MNRTYANDEIVFWATELQEMAKDILNYEKDHTTIASLIRCNCALAQVLSDLAADFKE